jgi:hypothetical protein
MFLPEAVVLKKFLGVGLGPVASCLSRRWVNHGTFLGGSIVMVVPPYRDGSYNGKIHINGGIHMVLKPRFITYQILDL